MENNKTLKITPPEGYEIDKEKSTFEEIIFKKVENKYPLSIKEVKGRLYFISSYGSIEKLSDDNKSPDKNNLSSESRAKAFLALMQLVELRDVWNKVDDFVPNWSNVNQQKYTISTKENQLLKYWTLLHQSNLYFGSIKTRDLFFETFKDLIEEAKELL